ncbi:MAG: hypothetical protein JXA90_07000, partial [Planctomycetes bacterium]|nr:hypothetical protein [Planctomycetota bacterium]
MPQKLDRELSSLKDQLVRMSTTAQAMFQRVLRALVDRDASLLEGLKEQEECTDRSQIEIDREVVRMMAVYGPVALDLRFVLMVARINSELERIGDMAVNMYENARLLLSEPELKKLVDLP